MKTRLQSLLTFVGIFCLLIAKAQSGTAVFTGSKVSSAPRPQVITFASTEKNKFISLNWSTISEKNSSHFVVERSADGLQFDSVGAVTALGRFDLPTSYEFIDLESNKGSSYYRVKIMGLDGASDYSSVLKIRSVKIRQNARSLVAAK